MAEQFRTNDMGLATYLRMCGYITVEVVWIDRTCHWMFELTPDLVVSVGEWEREEATVNPKQFTRQYARTKKEFYESKTTSG